MKIKATDLKRLTDLFSEKKHHNCSTKNVSSVHDDSENTKENLHLRVWYFLILTEHFWYRILG